MISRFMRRLLSRILAKILFCQETDLSNVLLHLPLGGVIAFIGCYVSGALAISAAIIFTLYEIVERKVISDRGFPDLQGALAGIIIGALVIFLVKAI